MPSLQQTKDQERANAAWNFVAQVKNDFPTEKDNYGRVVKKAPAMILANGLGQTLAFLKSKAKGKNNGHGLALKHLSGWVSKEIYGSDKADGFLLERLIGATGFEGQSDSNTYRRATTEAIAFLNWLKRFVEAENLGEENSDAA